MKNFDTKEIIRVRAKYGSDPKLAKTFEVSTTTISLSLNGHLNHEKAKKIRKAAVELGGDPIYNNN